MKQHTVDPKAIILPHVVMAFISKNGYHTFHCPVCERRNKVHEKRAINFVPGNPKTQTPDTWSGSGFLQFICAGCHREVHISQCPAGGLIVV